MAVTYLELRRGGQEGIGKFLQGGVTGGPTVWGGDVGADPKDRVGAGELHAWAALRITGKHPRRGVGGQCTYPPLKEAMREVGFEGIWKAVTRNQNTVAQYIATRPILDLCERATQRVGERVSRRWWDQEVIDLKAEN